MPGNRRRDVPTLQLQLQPSKSKENYKKQRHDEEETQRYGLANNRKSMMGAKEEKEDIGEIQQSGKVETTPSTSRTLSPSHSFSHSDSNYVKAHKIIEEIIFMYIFT